MLKKYLDIVINHPTVKRLEGLVKTTSLPGFHGIPIYDFGAFFIQEIKRDKLKVRASAIAFNFMLALFPSIIFIFTLFSYLPVSNPDMQIYEFIHEVFPENVSGFLLATIDDVTRIQRGGVLAVVIFMSFFFSMRGVNSLIQAFHKKGQTFKIRSFIGHRLAVLRLTAYLFLFFLASLVLIVAGNYTIDALTQRLDINHQLGKFMLGAFKWLLIVLLFFRGDFFYLSLRAGYQT